MPQQNKKNNLIADIKRLMSPQIHPQPKYDSYTANKVVSKLLLNGGVVVIIGLIMYIIGRDFNRNKNCRCD